MTPHDSSLHATTPHATPDQPLMTLDEARRVDLASHPQSANGDLLDQGRLTRADLLWALTKAYRSDVRRAAQRLLQKLDSEPSEQLTPQPMLPDATTTPAGPRVMIATNAMAAWIGEAWRRG